MIQLFYENFVLYYAFEISHNMDIIWCIIWCIVTPLTGCQSSCKHSPFVNVQIYICDIYFTDPFPVAQTADVTVIRGSKCMTYMGDAHLSHTRKLLCVKDTSDPAGDDLDFVSKNNY